MGLPIKTYQKNIHWSEQATHESMYSLVPLISKKLTRHCLQFAGQCSRPKGKVIQLSLLWNPTGTMHRREITFPDMLARDSGISSSDIEKALLDWRVWSKMILSLSICSIFLPFQVTTVSFIITYYYTMKYTILCLVSSYSISEYHK